ncbi:MAG TPA: winged helix-turn-helix domain-containing protein [Lachnospiraceae bacterium]|nr:winged helix-turn-helix domain-containing protein [Lachnospiraceae bacterium]
MDYVKIVHLITNEARFRLLQLLLKHHYCVKALSKILNISEPAVSQQIRILKQYDLIEGVKIGYQMHYRVNRDLITKALDSISMQIAMHPAVPDLVCDSDCTCEFEAECRKRDAKLLEKQKNDR